MRTIVGDLFIIIIILTEYFLFGLYFEIFFWQIIIQIVSVKGIQFMWKGNFFIYYCAPFDVVVDISFCVLLIVYNSFRIKFILMRYVFYNNSIMFTFKVLRCGVMFTDKRLLLLTIIFILFSYFIIYEQTKLAEWVVYE